MIWRAALITLLIFAQAVLGIDVAVAKTVELPVYRDWRGNDCKFVSERPFFLIKDIHELEEFWKKAGTGEPVPWIDFEKYMLFVWSPGPTMFDYRPVEVERLLYKDGSYIVLMNFQRKDSGGFWRRPFVATMLPLIRQGDIFVKRKVEHGPHKVEWKPLFSMWDMSGDRTRPFEVVQLDPDVQPEQFVQHAPEKPASTGRVVAKPVQTEPVQQTAAINTPSVQNTRPAVSQPAKTVPATGGTSGSALPDDDIFGSGFVQTSSTEEKNPPKTEAPPVKIDPAFEEDPLFGTEFDITF